MEKTPFLLNPEHADFKPGISTLEVSYVESSADNTSVWAIALVVALVCITVAIALYSQNEGTNANGFLIVGLLAGLFALAGFTDTARHSWGGIDALSGDQIKNLEHSGQLLEGSIMKAEYKYQTLGRSGYNHYIRVSYRFLNPKMSLRYGTQQKIRNDLRDTPLPTPGTPIQVLYLNDDNYMLL